MTEKRTGRQTAEAAENTKQNILFVAANLFSEKGFEKVSLREISEAANVSHGLLRHHFGNKMQIWKHICDLIFMGFQKKLDVASDSLPPDMPANQRLFHLVIRIMATLLVDPRPTKILADGTNQDDEMCEYIRNSPFKLENALHKELAKAQKLGYMQQATPKELEWIICTFCHAPSYIESFLCDTFEQFGGVEEAKLQHWKVCVNMLAPQLGIAHIDIPQPENLRDMRIALCETAECSILPSEIGLLR